MNTTLPPAAPGTGTAASAPRHLPSLRRWWILALVGCLGLHAVAASFHRAGGRWHMHVEVVVVSAPALQHGVGTTGSDVDGALPGGLFVHASQRAVAPGPGGAATGVFADAHATAGHVAAEHRHGGVGDHEHRFDDRSVVAVAGDGGAGSPAAADQATPVRGDDPGGPLGGLGPRPPGALVGGAWPPMVTTAMRSLVVLPPERPPRG